MSSVVQPKMTTIIQPIHPDLNEIVMSPTSTSMFSDEVPPYHEAYAYKLEKFIKSLLRLKIFSTGIDPGQDVIDFCHSNGIYQTTIAELTTQSGKIHSYRVTLASILLKIPSGFNEKTRLETSIGPQYSVSLGAPIPDYLIKAYSPVCIPFGDRLIPMIVPASKSEPSCCPYEKFLTTLSTKDRELLTNLVDKYSTMTHYASRFGKYIPEGDYMRIRRITKRVKDPPQTCYIKRKSQSSEEEPSKRRKISGEKSPKGYSESVMEALADEEEELTEDSNVGVPVSKIVTYSLEQPHFVGLKRPQQVQQQQVQQQTQQQEGWVLRSNPTSIPIPQELPEWSEVMSENQEYDFTEYGSSDQELDSIIAQHTNEPMPYETLQEIMNLDQPIVDKEVVHEEEVVPEEVVPREEEVVPEVVPTPPVVNSAPKTFDMLNLNQYLEPMKDESLDPEHLIDEEEPVKSISVIGDKLEYPGGEAKIFRGVLVDVNYEDFKRLGYYRPNGGTPNFFDKVPESLFAYFTEDFKSKWVCFEYCFLEQVFSEKNLAALIYTMDTTVEWRNEVKLYGIRHEELLKQLVFMNGSEHDKLLVERKLKYLLHTVNNLRCRVLDISLTSICSVNSALRVYKVLNANNYIMKNK